MDKKEIESLINQKESLFSTINHWRSKLIERKSGVRYDTDALWNQTIWEDVLTGKLTDKNKTAYVKANIGEAEEEVEFAENEIKALEQEIEVINDKLKYLSGASDD